MDFDSKENKKKENVVNEDFEQNNEVGRENYALESSKGDSENGNLNKQPDDTKETTDIHQSNNNNKNENNGNDDEDLTDCENNSDSLANVNTCVSETDDTSEEKLDNNTKDFKNNDELNCKSASSESDILDIFDNGLLIKKIIKRAPESDAEKVYVRGIIKVDLTGYITESNAIFDERLNYETMIGEGDLIVGLDTSIATMKVGEIAEIQIDPKYAFKDLRWNTSYKGEEIVLLPNTNLTYIVKVLAKEEEKLTDELPLEKLIHFSEQKKVWANSWFKAQDYGTAGTIYNRAMILLEKTNYASSKLDDIKVSIYNNLALTYMKLKSHSKAIEVLKKTLLVDKDNVKSLYFITQCYEERGFLDEALNAITSALKLEGNNIKIINLYNRIQERMQKAIEGENKMRKNLQMAFSSKKKNVEIQPDKVKNNGFANIILSSKTSLALLLGSACSILLATLYFRMG